MFQSNRGCYSPLCPVGNLSWLQDRPSYSPRIGHSQAEYSVEVDCEPFPSVCCGFQRVYRGVSFASWDYSGGLVLLRVLKNLQWPPWIRG